MKEVEYIIVGCGLAGVSFCEALRSHGHSFVVINNNSQQASIAAAGLYNPVVLKRFTPVWKAREQLELAKPFYQRLEQLLGVRLDYEMPVFRRFSSVEEQNNWFNASDRPLLENYLHPKIKANDNPNIQAPLGFGMVMNSGRIDTTALLRHYILYLKTINSYSPTAFDYSALDIQDDAVTYKNIRARYVVFAEGFGMVKNPYFNTLPLKVAKGEVLTIKAPELKMDFILKSSVFVVPVGDDHYSVGSTYNWEDTTNVPTTVAYKELSGKLDELISCPYEVVDHVAGVRPSVKDRRPLIGSHPKQRNLAVLNGLGTRGVMIAPYVASQLYNHLNQGAVLDPEIDIQRYIL